MNEPPSLTTDSVPPQLDRPKRLGIVETGPCGILACSIAGSFGRWHWTFDLFSHFRWYYFVLAAIWIIAIWRTSRRKSKWCLELAMVWNGVLLAPYYLPVQGAPVSTPSATFSLISVNVHTANQNKEAVVNYLRNKAPDLIVVMEVDQVWTDALVTLSDIYPHFHFRPRSDNFGIGVLAKRPLIDPKFVVFPGAETPTVITKVELDGRQFQLIGMHPPPPRDARNTDERNLQMRQAAEIVRQSQLPTVVAGDLNATPWSASFRDMISVSGLRDSALGLGVHGTWNANLPIRIPIDHVLIPQQLSVVRRAIGPNVGSDHFPVELTLSIE